MYIEQPLSLTLLRLMGKSMVNLRKVKINVAMGIVQKKKPRKYLSNRLLNVCNLGVKYNSQRRQVIDFLKCLSAEKCT